MVLIYSFGGDFLDVGSCVFTVEPHKVLLVLVKTVFLGTLFVRVEVKADMLVNLIKSVEFGALQKEMSFVTWH